ncbi:MAG: ECF transporter S component [Oscillospiraceae bacterium]|mgnify:FL=1|nr:ECF transporter S component [Oscillospiraceae bacterium]
MKKSKFSVETLAAIGVMAALVFITTKFFAIPIPVGVGGKTQIHLGNSMCVLAGLLFGGVPGGLAAGIGTAIVDLLDPLWAPEFWVSFINKFIMGFVAGTIATLGGTRTTSKNIIAAICGAFSYVLLYIGKSYLQQVALGSTKEAIVTVLTTKAITSCINAVVAIIVSVALYHLIAPALKKANLFQKK